ncbi:hypothetical protein U1Q18_044193 [Sarracenia purpurea var. burkii]
MQSFKAMTTPPTNSDLFCHSPFYLRGGDDSARNQTRFADLGELEQSTGFHQNDAVDLSRSSIYNNLQFGGLTANIGSAELGSAGTEVETGQFMLQKGTALMVGGGSLGNGNFENWGDSGMADNSQQTDTSTDVDTDDKNQLTLFKMGDGEALPRVIHQTLSHGVQHGALVVDSMDESKGRTGDQKTLRRLAQNREAARKSRLRKKAYVQQLEHSRVKLTRLEQELQRARQQGIFIAAGSSGDQSLSIGSNGSSHFSYVMNNVIILIDFVINLNSDNLVHVSPGCAIRCPFGEVSLFALLMPLAFFFDFAGSCVAVVLESVEKRNTVVFFLRPRIVTIVGIDS